MTMIRMGILLPLMARIESTSSAVTIHAAAVEKDDEVTLLVGLNGCGKSGLAWHLVSEHGFRLVSDNYVLVNTETLEATGVPEPLRLPHSEASKYLAFGARRIATAYGKDQIILPAELVTRVGRVRKIVFLSIDKHPRTRQLEPLHARNLMISISASLQETPSHQWPTTYYAMSDNKLLPQSEFERTRQLFEEVPAIQLTLKRSNISRERYQLAVDSITN